MTVLGRAYTLGPEESLRPSSASKSKSRLLAGGGETEGLYTFRYYLSEEPVHLHRHDEEDENVYVLSGNPTIRVGDTVHKLSPGSFIFMPKKIPHAIMVDAPWEGLSISSPGHIFDGLMDEMAALWSSGQVPSPEALGQALKRAGVTVLEGKWVGEAPIVQ